MSRNMGRIKPRHFGAIPDTGLPGWPKIRLATWVPWSDIRPRPAGSPSIALCAGPRPVSTALGSNVQPLPNPLRGEAPLVLHVERALCMSIVLGESQRDVRTRPYFRGRAVCSHADIGIGSVLARRRIRLIAGDF